MCVAAQSKAARLYLGRPVGEVTGATEIGVKTVRKRVARFEAE